MAFVLIPNIRSCPQSPTLCAKAVICHISPEIHQNGKIRKKKTKKIVHAICSTGWTVSYKCGILSFVQEEFFKLQHFECAGISRNVSSVSLPDKKACSTQMMTVSWKSNFFFAILQPLVSNWHSTGSSLLASDGVSASRAASAAAGWRVSMITSKNVNRLPRSVFRFVHQLVATSLAELKACSECGLGKESLNSWQQLEMKQTMLFFSEMRVQWFQQASETEEAARL